MAKRFILTWKDKDEEQRIRVWSEVLHISMAEVVHRLLAGESVFGKIESSTGKITWNKDGVKLIQGNGECVDVTPEELAARE